MFQIYLNLLQSIFKYIEIYFFLTIESEILEIHINYKLSGVFFVVFQMKNSVRKYYPGLCCTIKTATFHMKNSKLCTAIFV